MITGSPSYRRRYHRLMQRKVRADKRAMGLCYDCCRAAAPGVTRCEHHRDLHNVRRRVARTGTTDLTWPQKAHRKS